MPHFSALRRTASVSPEPPASASRSLGFLPTPCYFLMIMTAYLAYKAGPEALGLIRDGGLPPGRVGVFAAPAGGPKWFVSVGFDRAMIRSGFLSKGPGRVLLAGSSAGAWRCLTMACSDPLASHERLRLAYSRNIFSTEDTPRTIAAALRGNVDDFIADSDIPHILEHTAFDVAVHVVRARGPAASRHRFVEGPALVTAAALNALTPAAMGLFYQRVVFFAGRSVPSFLQDSFAGASHRLSVENLRHVALATGSLPYIVAGVTDLPGNPSAVYRDGGLTDYQLNQDYRPPDGTVTLFFHYQERIVPGWFDKVLSWRKPPKRVLRRVLQVYPTRAFLDLLPGKKLPDRTDFVDYVNNPHERIRRWDEVSRVSEILGNAFLESVESGKIRQLVQPMEPRSPL